VQNELANLDPQAVLAAKKLLQQALKDRNDPDALNLRESYSQVRLLATGRPAERFKKIANKEIKHKL
jgi:Delta3-Delta2-enoyl-CoA isomerase